MTPPRGTKSVWLELAGTFAEQFNRRMLKGFVLQELQADEIRTFVVGCKLD